MNPLMGTILLTGFDYAPKGWAVCDGTLVQIQSNTMLFALLGNRYGGDGQTTFGLPKLEAADGISTYIIATEGVFPPRD